MFYNTLKYHKASGKQLIPENLLRFNMWIKISEIRNFTSLRQYIKSNNSAKDIIRAIRKDVSALYYYVEDCEFDFNTVHSSVSNVSYSVEGSSDKFESLEFDVKFRRAFRLFKPTLLYALQGQSSNNNGKEKTTHIFHIDERMNAVFIDSKYYTQENPTLQNAQLPFNSLMNMGEKTNENEKNKRKFLNYIKEQISPVKQNLPRRRTIVPDGVIKGSALFKDKFNQYTKDTISVKNNNDEKGSFWHKAAGLAVDVGEAWIQTKIDTSIRGLKDTYAQKLIRSTNSSLTRMRNDLIKNLKNKVKNENVGIPNPTNVYTKNTSNNDINLILNTASRLTGVNFNNLRSTNEIKELNPSLKKKPLNIGKLQDGF
jgi:hypothetical protein